MSTIELNKTDYLSTSTFDVDGSAYNNSSHQDAKFMTPFGNQTIYGQRNQGKDFQTSDYPKDGTNWYEERAANSVDLEQSFDSENVLQFPGTTKLREGYSQPFNCPGVTNVWSSGAPLTDTYPDSIESFEVMGMEIPVAVVIVVILVILLAIAGLVVFSVKKNIGPEWMKKMVRATPLVNKLL